MKWLAAGVTLVNIATVAGLVLGMLSGGLDSSFAGLALIAGSVAAILAWYYSSPFLVRQTSVPAPEKPPSKNKRRRRKSAAILAAARPRSHFWLWIVGFVFAVFAVRSFCWLVYIDGPSYKIQSPDNLGDLALHLTYIKYLANGVALWPDNPIYVFSKLRYPVGIDLFNALLLLGHIDLIRGLVWVGLLASFATCYGFYRWGGSFAVAAFLFNGGIEGYHFFQTWQFIDYQGERIAWKSIPLTMFVTQRGLLYAIPAGLLLLIHWRRKFFADSPNESGETRRGLVPWWVEWSVYASMPLFHVHTFIALSIVLGFWLVAGNAAVRKQVALLLAAAFLPATGLIYLITDHFQAKSILAWAPGWLESDPGFSNSIAGFWIENFGLMLPATIILVGFVAWRTWQRWQKKELHSLDDSLAFVAPALAIFIFAFFVKTAPWSWDNTKLFIWSYFLILPFLWRDLIARWQWPIRAGICFVLFFSGFVTLLGGLKMGDYEIANRAEVDSVASAVQSLPISQRFAAYPTYNHPLLLAGRKVVLGYPGHLWTQGFDYAAVERELQSLMLGAPGWRERARDLGVRYLFWGNEEMRAYPSSTQPWRGTTAVVESGPWGTIYDLTTAAAGARQ